jgi:phosphatidylinositol glycan class B
MTYTDQKRLILFFAFIIFVISAIFNNGFHHFDEHYQIIEFAELKAGRNSASDLAWEYGAKIRPSFQPFIAYILFGLLRTAGILDHYTLMLMLRLCTAVLAFSIITYFFRKTEQFVDKGYRLGYLILAFFLWVSPIVNVRFSSETYSGLCICLAAGLIFSQNLWKFLLIGILLGLAFCFRFQTAFMSIGLVAWLTFIQKANLKQLLQICLGGVSALILGIVIDYWFYDSLTIPFYNYYVENIINGVASDFGVSPWFYYFVEFSYTAMLPIGILVWFSLAYQTFFKFRNFALWIALPFLFIHCITPHKELRFLMPMLNFMPLLIILTVQDIFQSLVTNKAAKQVTWIVCAIIFVPLNTCMLAITVMSPADTEGRMNVTQTIQNQYHGKKIKLWVTDNDNPYRPIPVQQNFYLNRKVNVKQVDSVVLAGNEHFSKDSVVLVTIRKDRLALNGALLRSYKLTQVASGIPGWVDRIKLRFNYPSESLLLYEVHPLNL